MRVVIVGGGAAGLVSSLLLARAGHEVVLLEQYDIDPATDVEAAAERAYRPSAPQIVHPHMVMARCRQLLMDHLPDVYEALLAAGVVEAALSTQMPATLTDTSTWPEDEHLTMLMARRSTLDWVLQRAVLAERGVEVHSGSPVLGPLNRDGRPPRITGIRTSRGDLHADVVVDAAGRRSPIDGWLKQIGARPAAVWSAECGLAYFSRHYRVRPGAELPRPITTRVMIGLDEFSAGLWGADSDTMQLAVIPLAADRRFRTLSDPSTFTAVLRGVDGFAAWLDGLEPTSPVFQMAGLHNTLRRLVVEADPVVTGVHAIGDSVCTTNPTLSRGLSLAVATAVDLVDVLRDHPDDYRSQTLAMDALIADHVAPFYDDQAAIDHHRLTILRHTVFGDPAPAAAPLDPQRVTYMELRAAAASDPVAFRSFWQVQGMVGRPDHVYTDPVVVACTHDALRAHDNAAARVEVPVG